MQLNCNIHSISFHAFLCNGDGWVCIMTRTYPLFLVMSSYPRHEYITVFSEIKKIVILKNINRVISIFFQKNPCEYGFIKHGGFLGAIGAFLAGNKPKDKEP